jgi:universal stress protein A
MKEYDSMITFNKILFPTDFSSAAEQAFDTAQRLARDSHSLLLIVHVITPTQVPAPPGAVVPPNVMANVAIPEDAEQKAEQARDALAKAVPDDGNIRFEHRLLGGVPGLEITRLAEEEKADLIVIGTHGRTGLSRLLMGSVAEAVVRRATCPVLTLRQSFADGDDSPDDSATG